MAGSALDLSRIAQKVATQVRHQVNDRPDLSL
jgi:hypothetical protein